MRHQSGVPSGKGIEHYQPEPSNYWPKALQYAREALRFWRLELAKGTLDLELYRNRREVMLAMAANARRQVREL